MGYKLNIGVIDRNVPAMKDLFKALEEFGHPKDSNVGVLEVKENDTYISGKFFNTKKKKFQRVDKENGDVSPRVIDANEVFEFAIKTGIISDQLLVEVYNGSIKSIEAFNGLLRCLWDKIGEVQAFPYDLSITQAVGALQGATTDCRVRSARVSEYEADSGIIGNYSAKFADSATGVDFIGGSNADKIKAVKCTFQGTKKVNVTLGLNSSFSYSCKEDDKTEVESYLRQIATSGTIKAVETSATGNEEEDS